ncbi:MAG: DUF488 domain-containing protein [Chitinophaga rupis]
MPIFTIGHGTRPIRELLDLLRKYDIDYLADVRTQPYSKFNPQYNRESLYRSLHQQNIRYVYLGDALGGRPHDPSCHDITGRVDYNLIRQQEFFKKGIQRLRSAHQQELKLALLCSERKPELCHRSKLIGRTLCEENIPVLHIDENGDLKSQNNLSVNTYLL